MPLAQAVAGALVAKDGGLEGALVLDIGQHAAGRGFREHQLIGQIIVNLPLHCQPGSCIGGYGHSQRTERQQQRQEPYEILMYHSRLPSTEFTVFFIIAYPQR